MQQVEFGVIVERWVRSRSAKDGDDPPFVLDGEGFLPAPAGQDNGWLRPSEAGAAGAWVLLGEPGSGKTTTFKNLAADQDQATSPLPGEPGMVWVTGSELADTMSAQEILGVHLDARPEITDTTSTPADLVLVIDQLDESPFLHHFPLWLKRKLAPRNNQNLRIWIACRTAEYRHELTGILKDALKSCVVGDLAPLTREDAAKLVASTGTDAQAFIDAVLDNAAEVLASVPLTLKVLLSAYQQDTEIVRWDPKRLYERGLARLADEHDPNRIPHLENTSREQRLAIAMRIAAHLVLSGRRTVHTGTFGNQSDQAVPIGAVIGDRESAGAGTFEVTKPMVTETLATALFSRTDADTAQFAHSSFAAFLTAQYLAARLTDPVPIPIPQLTGLFLVSAPDEDTAAIPEHLRETAAWLLAHAPDQARWLAVADPESLVGYSATITNPQTRALLVDGLLQRADRIELADRSWQRARWQLTHPDQVDQLSAALSTAPDNPTDNWAELARVRLAVRLAQDSGLTELAEPLLDVAETDSWPVALRQSAAKAAMSASPTIAAPRLRALLATLTPTTEPPSQDDEPTSDQPEWDITELVGTLLQVLWPDHLPFADTLPHIRPVTTRYFMGMYLVQVRTFPHHVAEQDLPALLTHTEQTLRAHGVVLDQPDPDITDQHDAGNPAMTPAHIVLVDNDHARNLRDFVAPIVDRILESDQAEDHLARIARILLWFLPSSERMPLPRAVDLVDTTGTEPASTTILRRQLTEELIRAARTSSDPNHHDYWTSTVAFSRWGRALPSADRDLPPGTRRAHRTRLLDAGDADWATARSQHYAPGDPTLADTFTRLASALAHTGAITAAEPAIVEIPEPGWELSDTFATVQRQRLEQAASGDSAAFWQLVRDLTANPKTGRYELVSSWDVSTYPGAALWPETELQNQLRNAARQYLSIEHDYHQGWLGTATTDWRAYAGYVALAILHAAAHDTDTSDPGLAAVSDQRWAFWVGAILHFAGHFGAVPDLPRDLLSHAALHAPAQLATALEQYVRTHLAHADTPLYLPDLPAPLTPTLTTLASELYTALRATTPDTSPDAATAEPAVIINDGPVTVAATSAAQEAAVITWTHLLHRPVHTGDPTATDLARNAISGHTAQPTSEIDLKLAAAAGHTLLTTDTTQHWPTVHEAITSSEAFARDLAFACAGDENGTATITEALPEAGLAQLYRWLATVCPPDTDILQAGFTWVSPERRVHDWRRTTISALAAHGTPEAVHQLRRLADAHPERLDLQAALLDARHGAQAAAASHLTPDQVTALLTDRTRRVVRTAAQLAEVIIETLNHIAADLPTHGNLLWDCERTTPAKDAPQGTPREQWRPKPEGSLGAYLAHELTLRLERSRIVVNREVMVHPTDAGDSGERPDITIDATTLDDHSAEAPIISIPLEIKGAWHKEVLTAQDTQLAQRYIVDLNTSAGVYLVGWYPLDQWNTLVAADRRKTEANRHGSSASLHTRLRQQVDTIESTTGRRTYPYVLTIPRATPRT